VKKIDCNPHYRRVSIQTHLQTWKGTNTRIHHDSWMFIGCDPRSEDEK